MATTLGNNLSTKVERKNSGQKTRTISGNTATYRYTQVKGTAVSTALGTADPADSTIVLREINFLPDPGGGFETVELVYGPPNPMSMNTPTVGTITYEADANVLEIPIQQHPNFYSGKLEDDGSYTANLHDWGQSGPGTDFPGLQSYLVPQPIFSRTEILSSFTFTEANIISNVGKICAPTGMTSPTSGAWLKTRLSVRKNGNIIEKSESWQYASAGWESYVYPTGT